MSLFVAFATACSQPFSDHDFIGLCPALGGEEMDLHDYPFFRDE